MQSVLKDKVYDVDEYFLLEESGEVRHEFINGNLYEMSGASREHHKICKKLLRFFESYLEKKGYETFIENMKVKIPGEKIYYYPDILITNEQQTDENRYVQFQPALLAEVVSDSSRKTDMVDKLIQYQKFSSLKYYLIVEQDKQEIIVVSCNADGKWQSETYNQPDAIINLSALEIQINLQEIYAL
ncbi:MAG: Uma2 family endonuclease [Parafilimonas sp.]